jgi:catalase
MSGEPQGSGQLRPEFLERGPRERPELGITSFPEEIAGPKQRVRSEKFADHYSQARQFYRSQSSPEQTHIKDAFVFELSKCKSPAIRVRMVSHLTNVDEELAKKVADALVTAAKEEDAMVELVAPKVGVTDSDGKLHPGQQKVNGGPSVLYDAVAILAAAEGARFLSNEATAKDFVSDAFAHAKFFAHTKFIAYAETAKPLLDKAGIAIDDGVIAIKSAKEAGAFVAQCRELRLWRREASVNSV